MVEYLKLIFKLLKDNAYAGFLGGYLGVALNVTVSKNLIEVLGLMSLIIVAVVIRANYENKLYKFLSRTAYIYLFVGILLIYGISFTDLKFWIGLIFLITLVEIREITLLNKKEKPE